MPSIAVNVALSQDTFFSNSRGISCCTTDRSTRRASPIGGSGLSTARPHRPLGRKDLNRSAHVPQLRKVTTDIPGPRSQHIAERRAREVSAAVYSSLPIYVERAQGGVVVDVDGNSFIDFGSGIAVTGVGNSAPAVVDAVQDQVELFTHTCFLLAPYENYVEVCAALNRLTPGDHDKKSALFNSGAEAVENAVKYARAFTGRSAIVVLDHSFHGRTNLTMAMTARAIPLKNGFGPFAGEVYRVPSSYPYRDGLDGAAAALRTIDLIDRQVGSSQVAAIVAEPIQGEGGFIVPAAGFMQALSLWCRDNGSLFVADEIQTGFGRTGDWFASQHEGVIPDLVTTAKGIAGGLPLSGVTGRADVMDVQRQGGIGGTYSGNPISCAAAIAAIRSIEDDGLVTRAKDIGAEILSRLSQIAAAQAVVGEVRGRGAMIGIELVKAGSSQPDAEAANKVVRDCLASGLLVLGAGSYGNVVRLLPPLVMPDDLLKEGLDVLETAITNL